MNNLEQFHYWNRLGNRFKLNILNMDTEITTDCKEDTDEIEKLLNSLPAGEIEKFMKQKIQEMLTARAKEYREKVLKEMGVWSE